MNWDKQSKKILGKPPTKQELDAQAKAEREEAAKARQDDKLTKVLGADLVKQLKDRYDQSAQQRTEMRKSIHQNILWAPHPGPQTDFLASPEYEVLFCGGRGPLAYGTTVVTPTGSVNIEDIVVGDVVCTPDGKTAIVIDIPFDGVAPCATLTFSDGRTVTSTIDHRWYGRTRKGKSGYQRKDRVVLTHEFKNGGQVPLATPVHHADQPVLLDPYMLGLLLGDGHMNTHISLTSWDPCIIEYCTALYPDATKYREGKEVRWIHQSRKDLREILLHYNLLGKLSNTKFIPHQYLFNSVDVRLAILQGLLDTDGSAGIGSAEFTTVSPQLAKDVQQLVWSLGGRATCSTKVGRYGDIDCQVAYRLHITLTTFCPFRLRRKAEIYTTYKEHNRKDYLTVVDYSDAGVLPSRCITVDHKDHQILVNDYVVTKNSGKSDCLLVDPLRFVTNPNFHGLMIRKTMPALREIISRAKKLYRDVYPGTVWKEQEKLFVFPSGATMEFGYFDHIDDYDRYHGRQFCWVGIDEISQYSSREYYDKIKSVARNTDPSLPVRVRATTNPSGPGRIWIKEYFIDISESGVPVVFKVQTPLGNIEVSRKYIKSTIFDNPTLLENDPQYIAYLAGLPEVQRRQWLEGDFEASDGLAFDEFHKNIHVVEPFDVPSNWVKFRAIDWGYRAKAVCLWFAISPEGELFVYREYTVSGMDADVFARNVLDLEKYEYISYGVIDGAVGNNGGSSGPTIEEDMIKEGLVNMWADKRKNSRVHGKMLIHKYLRVDPLTNEPRLRIVNTCKQLIKELGSLLVDSRNPEDVDTKMEDHAYDALRYGLMSRPDPYLGSYNNLEMNQLVLDSKFGY